MSPDDQKDLLRNIRLQLVKDLKLRETYTRSHTATGVWRRKDLMGIVEEDKSKSNVNERSLANLQKRRGSAYP